jgi:hypothetical protein
MPPSGRRYHYPLHYLVRPADHRTRPYTSDRFMDARAQRTVSMRSCPQIETSTLMKQNSTPRTESLLSTAHLQPESYGNYTATASSNQYASPRTASKQPSTTSYYGYHGFDNDENESRSAKGNNGSDDGKETDNDDAHHRSHSVQASQPARTPSYASAYASQPIASNISQYVPYSSTNYASGSFFQPQSSQLYELTNVLAIHGGLSRPNIASLPADVQASLGYLDRKFIKTGLDTSNVEQIDPRKLCGDRLGHSVLMNIRLSPSCPNTSRNVLCSRASMYHEHRYGHVLKCNLN